MSSRLEGLEEGALRVADGSERMQFGPGSGPLAEITVHDPRFWSALALRGSIGAGEAYAERWWSSPDPTSVVRLFVRNQSALSGVESGLARISRPMQAAFHALRRNSKVGSRANIRAHYDLSNEFFGLFLDDTLTYSCGIFADSSEDLRTASVRKIDRLCRKLQLKPSDHLLEIGTGWGAFAIHAAGEYGCRVTTTTISEEQHALARQRIHAAGLEDKITLLLEDYRNLEGQFDKLVSVEMIEAVGHQFYDDFFRACGRLLAPNGRMALQAITIADQHFDQARKSVDFIQRHIFPGSCIPSITALCSSATRASDLHLAHLEDIGPHYVTTLERWRANLRAHWNEARELGLSERFLRLWEFYFCYCEGGFAERHIGDAQMILVKPGDRAAPLLGALEG